MVSGTPGKEDTMRLSEYRTILDDNRLPQVQEVRRHNVQNSQLCTAEDVAIIAHDIFGNSADEAVWIFCVDCKCRLIGAFEASHGSLTTSIVDARSIFQKALLLNACSIFLCHNHPSGDVVPSQADTEATSQIQQAGRIIGVSLLDHVIIGNGYYSFRNEGLIQ